MKNLLLLPAFVLSLFAATTGGKLSDTARSLEKRGYVNVQKADPSIFVSLMYSRADNFTGEVLYTDLLTSSKLNRYLADIDLQASERLERLTEQMKQAEGITEQLKAENAMEWVQKMNNIRHRAEEIICREIIYA